MMNNTISKVDLTELQFAIAEAAAKLLAQRGYKLADHASDSDTGSVTLNIVPDNKEQQAFARHCGNFGLQPNQLQDTFTHHGISYVMLGYNTATRRFKVRRVWDGTEMTIAALHNNEFVWGTR